MQREPLYMLIVLFINYIMLCKQTKWRRSHWPHCLLMMLLVNKEYESLLQALP